MLVTARCSSSPCASSSSPSARRAESPAGGWCSAEAKRFCRATYSRSSRETTTGAGQSPSALSNASMAVPALCMPPPSSKVPASSVQSST